MCRPPICKILLRMHARKPHLFFPPNKELRRATCKKRRVQNAKARESDVLRRILAALREKKECPSETVKLCLKSVLLCPLKGSLQSVGRCILRVNAHCTPCMLLWPPYVPFALHLDCADAEGVQRGEEWYPFCLDWSTCCTGHGPWLGHCKS